MNQLNCVLLIDDHLPTNVLHQLAIESTKLVKQVKSFTKANDALLYLLENEHKNYVKPNLIFLDINMPGMNGWEFIEAYKRLPNEKKSDIVLLMLSTSTHPSDLEKAEQEDEVQDYIYKPLNAEIMEAVMEQYFKQTENLISQ